MAKQFIILEKDKITPEVINALRVEGASTAVTIYRDDDETVESDYCLLSTNIDFLNSTNNYRRYSEAEKDIAVAEIKLTGDLESGWIEKDLANKLSKIARYYDGSNNLIQEYKTHHNSIVGEYCLNRSYVYNGFNKLVGETVSFIIWTQDMEDAVSTGVEPYSDLKSVVFDGVNDYANAGDKHLYDIGDQVTYSFWMKPSNVTNWQAIFSKYITGPTKGISFNISTVGSKFNLQVWHNSFHNMYFNTVLSIDTWYHIVLTYSGNSNLSGYTLYVDGVKDTATGSGTFSTTMLASQDFRLSGRTDGFYYEGLLNEFQVWDTELSQAEVTELYNAGVPIDPASHSASVNLQSSYRMGDGDTYATLSDSKGTDDLTMNNMTASDIVSEVP